MAVPGPGDPAYGHSCFNHFLVAFLKYALHWAVLEDHLEATDCTLFIKVLNVYI